MVNWLKRKSAIGITSDKIAELTRKYQQQGNSIHRYKIGESGVASYDYNDAKKRVEPLAPKKDET